MAYVAAQSKPFCLVQVTMSHGIRFSSSGVTVWIWTWRGEYWRWTSTLFGSRSGKLGSFKEPNPSVPLLNNIAARTRATRNATNLISINYPKDRYRLSRASQHALFEPPTNISLFPDRGSPIHFPTPPNTSPILPSSWVFCTLVARTQNRPSPSLSRVASYSTPSNDIRYLHIKLSFSSLDGNIITVNSKWVWFVSISTLNERC